MNVAVPVGWGPLFFKECLGIVVLFWHRECMSRGMATVDTSLPSRAAAPVAKVPLMTLLVCCVVSVVFAVAAAMGAIAFLTRSGKLGWAVGPAATVAKRGAEVGTHPKTLEPMLINLADEGGHAYMRLGVVLAEEDEPGPRPNEDTKPSAGDDASVRDTIFDVLGRQTSTVLLAPDGKEKLKSELMAAIGQRNPELHVKTIYFTDFLVQR